MKTLNKAVGAALLLAGLHGFTAGTVSASPVTLDFSGTLSYANPFISIYGAGTAITGSITYNSAATDSVASPLIGGYLGAATSVTFSIGAAAGAGSGSIGIGNDLVPFSGPPGDVFQSLGGATFSGLSSGGSTYNFDFAFRLRDNEAGAFSDDSLPLNADFFSGGSFAGVSDTSSLSFYLSGGTGFAGVSGQGLVDEQTGGFLAMFATIDSVSVASVSEPALFVLFGLGTLGLGCLNRRARRRKATT